MFSCDCCGCCCRNLKKSELYAQLDRGDGTCIYLKENLCTIFDKRPLLCRVDACYELYFREYMTRDEYYRLNKLGCENLKTYTYQQNSSIGILTIILRKKSTIFS